ncbi:MAG TPA: YebC/PmpR family DNA-binding transcriptional regulator [Bacilli bacterium]|nr:YebC/PmpR family DNA-binding transcriptional regulator [Bacilli bacterium]
MGRAHEVRAASMTKTAAAKSKLNAKFSMLIYRAAKTGIPDPEVNQNLKKEIEKAKKAQIPADLIKRTIEKAKGGADDAYTEIRYEGFGPGNSQIIVECLTDNVNRTYTAVRTILSKTGCKMGVPGSVTHMFSNQAIFSFEGFTDEETLDLLVAADCDVTDIQIDEGMVSVFAPSTEYSKIKAALSEANPEIEFLEDKLAWIPMSYITLSEEDVPSMQRVLTLLNEEDDVQEVFHNVEGLPALEE